MKTEIETIQKALAEFVAEMDDTKEHDGIVYMELHVYHLTYDYYCNIYNSLGNGVSATGKTPHEAYWRAVERYESKP